MHRSGKINDKHSVVKMVSDGREFSVLSQEEYILLDVVIFVYSKDFSLLSSQVLSLFEQSIYQFSLVNSWLFIVIKFWCWTELLSNISHCE